MEESIQSFNSLNGGITMWLGRLADRLVEDGTDEFLKQMQEEFDHTLHTQNQNSQNNIYFLINGINSIDKSTLEQAIASLREPYQRAKNLRESYQQCVESLEQADHRWNSYAESAKSLLEILGKWACETEVARSKKLIRSQHSLLSPIFPLKYCGGWSVLNSPQQLRANLTHFKDKVNEINHVIDRSYIAGDLPQNLSPSDFRTAIKSLEEQQEQANNLSNKVSRAIEDLESAEASYFSQRQPLFNLLWQMPETAHWALFRICRPDLL